jgi:hypothetical protein
MFSLYSNGTQMEELKNIEKLSQEASRNKLVTVLVSALIILSGLDLYLYSRLGDVKVVKASYSALENRTETLETYYLQIQNQYSSLMTDYTDMKGRYDTLVQSNALLQREYNDVLNHGKQFIVEEKKSLILQPGENMTITYDIPASGYIEVEVDSTKEVFVWVGSTYVKGIFYARFPSFPETASVFSFKVPVSPTMYFFVENADIDEAEIEYGINLVY